MTRLTGSVHEPDTTEQQQARQALVELKGALKAVDADVVDISVKGIQDVVRLPMSVIKLLNRVLANYAAGQGVSIVPAHAELTTQQAANMLNVSRPYLVKLLDCGEIKHSKVGTHRRILASSLNEYRAKQEIETRSAVDELVALGQEMDLY